MPSVLLPSRWPLLQTDHGPQNRTGQVATTESPEKALQSRPVPSILI
jgi:hypothetical protein